MATESLTLPLFAPPLPDVDGLSHKGAGLIVVRPLVHQVDVCRAVERDEGELRQVDLMDPMEELLPHAWIHCRLFLRVEGIQGRIAVEVQVGSHAFRWNLVAREHEGIVGVIAQAGRILCDVIPARDRSRGR